VSGLLEIANALADYLREGYAELEETEGIAFQVEPKYLVNPSPPTIDIYPGRSPARALEAGGMGGAEFGGYVLTVRFRMLTADYDAGHELLYLVADDESDYSLAVGIESSYPLDGRVASIVVLDFSGLTIYPEGEFEKWIGFEHSVTIIPALS